MKQSNPFNNNRNKGKWKITTNRFIGFIDIMGFKDMVARHTHKDIYDKLLKIAEFKTIAQKRNVASRNPPKVFIFSDSIIIFSKDDSDLSLTELLFHIGHLTQVLLENTIPFKGAIASGEISVDEKNSIFFGQPLIDAYLLEEELGIYAVAVHHSAEQAILTSTINPGFVFEYNTPLKSGIARHYLVSSFAYYFMRDTEIKLLSSNEIMMNFRKMTSGALRKYIDNSEIFYEAVFKKFNDNPDALYELIDKVLFNLSASEKGAENVHINKDPIDLYKPLPDFFK